MPKINIKENDYTLPGLEGGTNFSVVVIGARRFRYKEEMTSTEVGYDTAILSPFDANGVYEVNNPNDFLANVGPVPARDIVATDDDNNKHSFKSYGNQIAYDLLNLGYNILYVDMGYDDLGGGLESAAEIKKNFLDLASDNPAILEPLKDKVSYNFRFIISGINVSDSISDDTIKQNTQLKYISIGKNLAWLASFKESDLNSITEKVVGTEITYALGKSIRGDCTALVDIDETLYNNNLTGFEAIKSIQLSATNICSGLNEGHTKTTIDHGKYLGLYAPSVIFETLPSCSASVEKTVGEEIITYTYKYSSTPGIEPTVNTKMPAYFYYLACFAHSIRDLDFTEWYAAAGLTRGVSVLKPVKTTISLGEIAINLLEPRYKLEIAGESGVYFKNAVNVITKVRNSYVLWGNRTAYELGTNGEDDGDLVASHFMNIRQLCTTLKKEIYQACKKFTFDPNSDVLWVNFCNTIRPTLESMKANQGIENYAIEKIPTEQKATLKARVRIVPIEAVEDFDIEVALEDSITGETTTTVLE